MATNPFAVMPAAVQTRAQAEHAPLRVGFGLFIALTGYLFVRPLEVFPALREVYMYQVILGACIATCGLAMLRQLTWRSLRSDPATFCVVMLMPAIALSHLAHGVVWAAWFGVTEFFGVLLYFLLLISVLNSTERLRRYLGWVVIFMTITAGLAVSHFHGLIRLDTDEYGMSIIDRTYGIDDETGQAAQVPQLCASGLFSDPNDFGAMLAAVLVLNLGCFLNSRGATRLLWVVPAPLLIYAFVLTQSRGAFLVLLAGAAVLIVGRWGWKRSIPLMILIIPALLFAFGGGRQTDINFDGGDTGAGRMYLWREAYVLFKTAPVFGIGHDFLAGEIGHVAHNSFVQCFAELGFFGGTFFTGAVLLPILTLRPRRAVIATLETDPLLRCWRPFLLAALVGYAIGICTLTRSYTLTTYALFGGGIAYMKLLRSLSGELVPKLDKSTGFLLAKLSVACFVLHYVAIRVLIS